MDMAVGKFEYILFKNFVGLIRVTEDLVIRSHMINYTFSQSTYMIFCTMSLYLLIREAPCECSISIKAWYCQVPV